jgi:polyisoprenoid-binding protein YceI
MLPRLALLWFAITLPALAAEAPLDLKQTTLTFTGHATLHDFHGQAQDFHGSAQVDAANPNLVTAASLNIDAARLTTFQDTRDRHMQAWLGVDANPKIEFRLGKITRTGGDPVHANRASPASFAVSGEFTLNDTTRPLNANVMGWREVPLLIIEGTARIDTTQFGLPVIQQFFLTVDKNVDVAFHLVFDLPSAP